MAGVANAGSNEVAEKAIKEMPGTLSGALHRKWCQHALRVPYCLSAAIGGNSMDACTSWMSYSIHIMLIIYQEEVLMLT